MVTKDEVASFILLAESCVAIARLVRGGGRSKPSNRVKVGGPTARRQSNKRQEEEEEEDDEDDDEEEDEENEEEDDDEEEDIKW